jgi:16S rRNA (cytosine1402-N4)-methyltransferase
MDLGVSSPQIDNPQRGFSFRQDGPLDMRMDSSQGQSVYDWLAHAKTEQIAQVIRDLGEERFANGIAKAITAKREAGQLPDTTLGMASLVAEVVKTREPGQNPATRTFQAFRMYINSELDELQQALDASLQVLQPGGRLVVISFHSLEDRMVKQFITQHSREVYDRRTPFAAVPPLPLRALGRQRPSAEEVKANPRSRSAIMRVAERVSTTQELA